MEAPENIDIPSLRSALMALLGDDAKHYPEQMEKLFPRILVNIVSLWGKPDLDAYLANLMVSDRPGRQGFPAAVAMEVFRLSTIHGMLGLSSVQSGTGWSGVDDSELYRKALTKDNK